MKLPAAALRLRHSKVARKTLVGFLALSCALGVYLFPSANQKSNAQEQDSARNKPNKAELHQALLDLTSPWTVMCVAAHPDDEDGTTLTVLRRKHGVHTVSLFSTYGEGGQNAVGPELYEELGVIRARETMEASKIQGSEPYFLGLKDFGFSKSAGETFRVWSKEEALRRMVLKIRQLRPDVILTNHDTSRGHGHHQATGQLILEAFDAAANPKRFPDQLKRTGVWQPQRLFVRYRPPSGTDAKPDGGKAEKLVTIDPNERDPVRGTTYAEQALSALQKHASQGPWPKTIAERLAAQSNSSQGLPLIRYQLAREAQGAPPPGNEPKGVFDGLTLDSRITADLAPPTIEGSPLTALVDQPERVLNALIAWRRGQKSPPKPEVGQQHRFRLLGERANAALALISGVELSMNSRNSVLVAGVPARFSLNLLNSGDRTVLINKLSFTGWGNNSSVDAADQLSADSETSARIDRVTPTGAAITVPRADHLYDGRFFGERFEARADLEISGAKFSISTGMNLPVVPSVEIVSISPSVAVWTPNTLGHAWNFRLKLANHKAEVFRGKAKFLTRSPLGFVGPEILLRPYETREVEFAGIGPSPRKIARVQRHSGVVSLSIYRLDSHEAVTSRNLRLVYSDAKVVRDLRVGYLPSFDKTLEQSLGALGVNAKELGMDEIQKGELSVYDTIVIDNRGYYAHPELIGANTRVLDYVHKGGTLIVFYHKDNEWNPDQKRSRPQLAPYPIVLGGERVTVETALVAFLQPGHGMLNFPNRITRADFAHWIQERGLYFPKEWDSRYQALFAIADQGEAPLRSGLLVAPYGRGNYIYTSMVWYRQLAVGVPGAYRMFANMISYGRRNHSQNSVP